MSDEKNIPTWEEVKATYSPIIREAVEGVDCADPQAAADLAMILIVQYLEMSFLAGRMDGINAASKMFDTAMDKAFGPTSPESALLKMEVRGPTQ
jgi:hypothetical protein